MMMTSLIGFKSVSISLYLLSILYVHFRGQVRLKFFRQLTDHSSLLAPINAVMYGFSSVPRTPFLKVEDFPELGILKKNWQIIREEAQKLYDEGCISASDQYDDIGFNSFFRRGWKRFYLKWYQQSIPSAHALCPKTLAMIESIPSINAAMFALLPKKSFLFPHRDPYAGSLRYHLGLVTPNSDQCCIQVDGQTYAWHDGEDVIFDETFVHSAENQTETDRIILFCDVKRPLTHRWAERFNHLFSRTVMKAASSKNVPSEQVGSLNRLFKYLYRFRQLGKHLKALNRFVYYLLKYALLSGLFWFLLK